MLLSCVVCNWLYFFGAGLLLLCLGVIVVAVRRCLFFVLWLRCCLQCVGHVCVNLVCRLLLLSVSDGCHFLLLISCCSSLLSSVDC